jgi:adenylate kinase family enzyme
MAKNLIPIGPPGVGKGFTSKKLDATFGEKTIFPVSMGDCVRRRISEDEDFAQLYKEVEGSGGLIPDDEVLAMLRVEHIRGAMYSPDLFVWDGCFRTAAQARFAVSKKLVEKDDTLCVILNATKSTCNRRYTHRVTNTGKGRGDNESFDGRFKLFHHHRHSVLSVFRSAGFQFVQVDADRELDEVATDIATFVTGRLGISPKIIPLRPTG